MSLAQENFDRAVEQSADTLPRLSPPALELAQIPTVDLARMAWDLDCISAALREEYHTRPENREPQDFG